MQFIVSSQKSYVIDWKCCQDRGETDGDGDNNRAHASELLRSLRAAVPLKSPFQPALHKCTPTVTLQPDTAGWRHTDVLGTKCTAEHITELLGTKCTAEHITELFQYFNDVQRHTKCNKIVVKYKCTIVHPTNKVQATLTDGRSLLLQCVQLTLTAVQSVTAVCSTDIYCCTKSVTAMCSTDTYCCTKCYCSVFN
jgi:hypothetical protein